MVRSFFSVLKFAINFSPTFSSINFVEGWQTKISDCDTAGFANVTDACCGDGILGGFLQCGKEGYTVCKNPNEYLFWDFFHPSEHTYKLIAKALWAGGHTRIRPLNLKTLANMNLPH